MLFAEATAGATKNGIQANGLLVSNWPAHNPPPPQPVLATLLFFLLPVY
jgi:hypothetical protein